MDFAACYDIESKIFNSRQGTLSVIEYYGTLNGLWIGIFKFLHGLNSKYNPIRVQILGKEKLPEEARRLVIFDKGSSNTGSAMMTRKCFTKGSTGSKKGSTFEGKPFTKSSRGEYCTYCKRLGHTKATCYKLYGKEKVLE
ncbi:hypothetical protein CR513_31053, partial [Mucuna pruriens]